MSDIHADRILILDFGSQFTQLIARRIRELGVYSELHPWDMTDDAVRAFKPKGVILSGGPESVAAPGSPRVPEAVWQLGVPVLGICYGMQAMAQKFGGVVEPHDSKEFGYAEIRARGHSPLFKDIQDRANAEGHGLLDVWMSHGDRVTQLPPDFKLIASTPDLPLAGMMNEARKYYGVQFHPEVTHTKQGARIYSRFVHEICGCGSAWAPPRASSKTPWRVCAPRWGRARCCWVFPVAWIPPWWRPCCTRRSATSSPACSSTTACCARAKAMQ